MSFVPNASFETYRSWLWGRYSSTYQCVAPTDTVTLSKIINGFVQFILPEIVNLETGKLVPNIKGRNIRDVLISCLPAPASEETLRIGGTIASHRTKEEFDWEPLNIVCASRFAGFSSDNGILYSGETERSKSLPTWFPLRLIGAAAPIRPIFFRFASEHFRPVRSFAAIGVSPQVTESLLIDCSENQLALRLSIESKAPLSRELLTRTPCVTSSAHVLSRILGWNFVDDLLSRIAR